MGMGMGGVRAFLMIFGIPPGPLCTGMTVRSNAQIACHWTRTWNFMEMAINMNTQKMA
jgi:hypothetical protein